MKKTTYISVLMLIFGIVIGYIGHCTFVVDDTYIVRDTIIDTMTYYEPTLIDSTIIRYETVYVPVKRDSICVKDSVSLVYDSVHVVLPITQKHYTDSTYEAWVSGYDPSLDSIKLYMPTITNTIIKKEKVKRYSIGVTTGYGVTDKGLSPYIGVGITYSLFKF